MKKKEKSRKDQKPKNYAFIDSQNLNRGVISQKWELDYGKFRLMLRNKYNVTRAFLFIGYIPKNHRLYSKLQALGYILVFKNVLEIKRGNEKLYKGNVDAELVLHAMIEFPNYDKAVIVSGDGDFFCLVEYLSKKKKLLKMIVPNQKYSSLLRDFASNIVSIQSFKGKLKK
ncbi:MAG: NYN domain-containing protein [Candidatus Dojkabacteria bacterium]|nr:MAG: NYN domain-containing protein [Candidatus Dojkabacteria bacterium]